MAQVTSQGESAAQDGAADGEILVTARRRAERPIESPVVVTAFSGDQLRERGVASVPDIARLTPQLTIEPNFNSSAGALTLRGVTSPTGTTGAEPAVTINIDGVPLSSGAAVRFSQFDIGQVEVLKGPQALFFGKNSSGGILAIKSAEPTGKFESRIDLGYETEARNMTAEAMVSGGLAENLYARVSGRFAEAEGPFINLAPTAPSRRTQNERNRSIRGVLVFEPSSAFRVKAIAAYDQMKADSPRTIVQRIFCPLGIPAGPSAGGSTDCVADRYTSSGGLPAGAGAIDPVFGDGSSYAEFEQRLGVLDAQYEFANGMTFNSVSGYYKLNQSFGDNVLTGAVPVLSAGGIQSKSAFTQEVRLSSPDDDRFTWMVGGFLQDENLKDREAVLSFSAPSTVVRTAPPSNWNIDSRLYSAFGQASYKLFDSLTLSAGVRYTDETKRQNVDRSTKFIPEVRFKDTSPEFTLSYRPNEDSNIFVSYKQGYKSGSFQIASLAFNAPIANAAVTSIDNSYGKESVEGVEGGVKLALFDRSLRIDLTAYDYTYNDLQLSDFDPVLIVNRVTNVSKAKVRGIEMSADYRTPMDGLRLRGSVAYNKATYGHFLSTCYTGQTIAGGCTIDGPDADTKPDRQDLTGQSLPRAPRWAGNVGFSFDRDVDTDHKISLSLDGIFQSKSFLAQEATPWGVRPETFLLDARLAFGASNGSWEAALVGKNLTNKFYPVSGYQEPTTGSPATTGTVTGIPSDYSAVVHRGREVWIRLTFRPNLF